jgi:hypothetical protein
MAVGTGTVWELRAGATAANVNGGGFNPGNANFPTDLVATTANTASPVITSASYNFVAGDAGAWLYIKSGTNWLPGWYQIASVSSGAATLNADVGQAIVTDSTKGAPTPKYGLNTVAGCASVASPSSGTWGVDYSQQSAAQFHATDLASGGVNTSITSATNPFGVNMVGNVIHITAGTSWTQGWYEIVSVSGSTATTDRSVGGTSLSGGTYYTGGAISLGSSTTNQTDTNFFSGTHIPSAGGNRFFVQNGSFSPQAITVAGGAVGLPHVLEGYNSTRGDAPTGSSRPTLSMSANALTLGLYNYVVNLYITGTNTGGNGVLIGSSNCTVRNCKVFNTSTTANKNAIYLGSDMLVADTEAVSYRGYAIEASGAARAALFGCYVHDSNIGIYYLGGGLLVIDCIVESCVSSAINPASGNSNSLLVIGCTLVGSYGAGSTPTGTGINMTGGATNASLWVFNCNIIGFATGISGYASNASAISDWNNYYGNTTDVVNWQKGPHDVALDPQFSNVAQVNGTTAITLSGNKLQDSAKNFSTLGVTANQDFLYVISGTGPTAGQYLITAISTTTNPNDTLTVDQTLTANATANKAYQITTGRNFSQGQNLKAKGFPGVFQAGLTTGYADIGAAQHQDSPSSYFIGQTINYYM